MLRNIYNEKFSLNTYIIIKRCHETKYSKFDELLITFFKNLHLCKISLLTKNILIDIRETKYYFENNTIVLVSNIL